MVLPLFAFSVMRFRRERNGFVESAAQHAKIVEALPEMSAGYLRDLMKGLVGCWKDEMLEPLLSEDGAGEDEGGASGQSPFVNGQEFFRQGRAAAPPQFQRTVNRRRGPLASQQSGHPSASLFSRGWTFSKLHPPWRCS